MDAEDPTTRFNDGSVDPAGRFWAGTMAYDLSPGVAALYRLDADHHVERVLNAVTLSNGIAWSPDSATMYFIDSATNGVDAFRYEAASGSVSQRRRVPDVPRAAGMPDGMTVDSEGCLWVALSRGSAVHRYRPDGGLDAVVEVPTANVTSCCFGGPSLDVLFVTSARDGLDDSTLASQPLAGALFRCEPGVTGLPSPRFGGVTCVPPVGRPYDRTDEATARRRGSREQAVVSDSQPSRARRARDRPPHPHRPAEAR